MTAGCFDILVRSRQIYRAEKWCVTDKTKFKFKNTIETKKQETNEVYVVGKEIHTISGFWITYNFKIHFQLIILMCPTLQQFLLHTDSQKKDIHCLNLGDGFWQH